MTAIRTRIAHCAAAFALLTGGAGCASTAQSKSVTIMVPWSGNEFQAFYTIVKKFEKDNPGITVDVEVTRAQTQQLDAAVHAGHAPDLAVLPSVGAVEHFADELQQLEVGAGSFTAPFRELMTLDNSDRVRVVPIKADVKSLVWYNADTYGGKPPAAPDQLEMLSAGHPELWCLGLASGPTSGWPGADWIADLVLETDGSGVYRDWVTGGTHWSDSPVKDAWAAWGNLVHGTLDKARTTSFAQAIRNGGCSLGHGALAAVNLPAGAHYDFVNPGPPAGLQVSADFIGMFSKDNPSAQALVGYLARADIQTLWVQSDGSNAFSANTSVQPGVYRSDLQQRIAGLLQHPPSGSSLCFSAADAMPPDLSAAFYQAVMDYAQNPDRLPQLLAGLDRIQASQRTSPHAVPLCSP